VAWSAAQTNMVFFTLHPSLVGKFAPFMRERGILIGDGPGSIRAVTHYGIGAADIERVVQAAADFGRAHFHPA